MKCICATPDDGQFQPTPDGRWKAVCSMCEGDATAAMAEAYNIPPEATVEEASKLMFDAILSGGK